MNDKFKMDQKTIALIAKATEDLKLNTKSSKYLISITRQTYIMGIERGLEIAKEIYDNK